jgi:hypothetical protein
VWLRQPVKEEALPWQHALMAITQAKLECLPGMLWWLPELCYVHILATILVEQDSWWLCALCSDQARNKSGQY